MTKINKTSKQDKTKKNQNVTKLNNSKYDNSKWDKTKKLQILQNSKPKNVTKIKKFQI